MAAEEHRNKVNTTPQVRVEWATAPSAAYGHIAKERNDLVALAQPAVEAADATEEHIDPVGQGEWFCGPQKPSEWFRPIPPDQVARAKMPDLFQLDVSKSEDHIFGIHDANGRSLVEFCIKDGKLDAKYFAADLYDAAKLFVEYVKTLGLEG